jgi:hypothetical protein
MSRVARLQHATYQQPRKQRSFNMKNFATGVVTAGVLAAAALVRRFGCRRPGLAQLGCGSDQPAARTRLHRFGQRGERAAIFAAAGCSVDSISGRAGTDSNGQPITPAQAGTVHVNINCPSDES